MIKVGQVFKNSRGWEREVLEVSDSPKDGFWSKHVTKASKWVKVRRLSGNWVSHAGESQEWWMTESSLQKWGEVVE